MSDRVLRGRYVVQDRIGTGGMAIVYRGLDEVLGRTVAIKTMLPQYAADHSFAARFKQEAQAAAALQSPYIVSVYDWGKDGDTYFIVMEYLHGTDLKSGIRKHGALDSKKVAQIGSEIASALSVAHRHDIIHRDIKPQNIMVQPDGNIKVMDFGIARAKNSHLTTDNSVLGTAHYVSPEQTQGKELGPTTDIYSLGIVMYEAATGKVPFDGDDAISVALKQVNEQPKPPSQLNPKVDAALESIILKCMQKDPAQRFQSADELARTLREYLAGHYQAVSSATATIPVNNSTTVLPPAPLVSDTATFPRPVHGRSGRERQNASATQRVREEEQKAEKRHIRNVVLSAFIGTLLLIGIIVAAFTYIRSNSEMRAVPNFLNLTQEQALSEIQSSGFWEQGTIKTEYSSTVAEGLVIDQDPDSGRMMAKGTKISLVISKGEEPAASVSVPDLSNMTPSEAEEALRKVGLVGQAGDTVFDEKIEAGKIVSQSPAANSTAKAGDVVTYQISKGEETLDVPDVSGKSESAARQALQDAGFNVQISQQESDSVQKGMVISYSPTGKAAKGSTVTIVISAGSSSAQVPNVVGKSESEAKSALQNAGFSVNVNYQSGGGQAGTVVSQSQSGTAKAGSTITITVAQNNSGGGGGNN